MQRLESERDRTISLLPAAHLPVWPLELRVNFQVAVFADFCCRAPSNQEPRPPPPLTRGLSRLLPTASPQGGLCAHPRAASAAPSPIPLSVTSVNYFQRLTSFSLLPPTQCVKTLANSEMIDHSLLPHHAAGGLDSTPKQHPLIFHFLNFFFLLAVA